MTDTYTTHVTHTCSGTAIHLMLGDCSGTVFWAADDWVTTFNRYIPCIERRGRYSPNHLAFHVKTKRLRKKYALVKDIILMRSIQLAPRRTNTECINEYITREDGTSTYEKSSSMVEPTRSIFCGASSAPCEDQAT